MKETHKALLFILIICILAQLVLIYDFYTNDPPPSEMHIIKFTLIDIQFESDTDIGFGMNNLVTIPIIVYILYLGYNLLTKNKSNKV